MQKLLIIPAIAIIGLFGSRIQAISNIEDVHYVTTMIGNDLRNKNVCNSKSNPARILNGFIECYNLTALIARCEIDKNAKINLTDDNDRQIVMGCPHAAHYILKTINEYNNQGYVKEMPIETKKRLEKSWIKIMQQGNWSFEECKRSEIE
jgi:hypothetical protein